MKFSRADWILMLGIMIIVALTISFVENSIIINKLTEDKKCISDEYTEYKLADIDTSLCIQNVYSGDKTLVGSLTRATEMFNCINDGVSQKSTILRLSQCKG